MKNDECGIVESLRSIFLDKAKINKNIKTTEFQKYSIVNLKYSFLYNGSTHEILYRLD